MTAPAIGTCSPWATEDDLCAPCAAPDADDELVASAADWLQAASNIVYNLSGRQFPGVCEAVVRPCAAWTGGARRADDAVPGWHRSWGSCGCAGACVCPGRLRVELGAYPIADIIEVRIDGEVLSPERYRVDESRWLVRLEDADGTNPGWPATQQLDRSDDEEGTWSVAFTWGFEPPPEGVKAVAVLACELALGCRPDLASKCRLPKQVTSVTAEGVTMVMSPSDFLDKDGKTGIWELDLFIRSTNPQRAQRNGQVWSPGLARRGFRPPQPSGS